MQLLNCFSRHVFKFDPTFLENEEEHKSMKAEILGEDEESESDDDDSDASDEDGRPSSTPIVAHI
jgi:hypothetical protein